MESEIINIIGHELAERFFLSFSGVLLYVPKHIDETHKISICIGLDAAIKLSRLLSGQTLSISTRQTRHLDRRNQIIKQERNGGALINELALKYQLTSRQIVTILKTTGNTQ